MLRASKHLLVGLTALLALAGAPTAQAAPNQNGKNVCVNACLDPYVDAGEVTSAVTNACTSACKAMNKPRRTCLREGEFGQIG